MRFILNEKQRIYDTLLLNKPLVWFMNADTVTTKSIKLKQWFIDNKKLLVEEIRLNYVTNINALKAKRFVIDSHGQAMYI